MTIIEQFIEEKGDTVFNHGTSTSKIIGTFADYLQSNGYEIVKKKDCKHVTTKEVCVTCGAEWIWEGEGEMPPTPETPTLPEKINYENYSIVDMVKTINSLISYLAKK